MTAEELERLSPEALERLRVRVGSDFIDDILRPLRARRESERTAEAAKAARVRAVLRMTHGPFYRESVYALDVSAAGKRFGTT